MDKGEYIKNNFSEEDIRFYMDKYHDDFGLTSIYGTHIVGTPDVIAESPDGIKCIELKRNLADINHQLRKNALINVTDVWYINDNASKHIKELLLQKNVKLINIVNFIDIKKLDLIHRINRLARECYRLMLNLNFLLICPTRIIKILEKIGINNPDTTKYEVDEYFNALFDVHHYNYILFQELEENLANYQDSVQTERIKLAKRRKTENLNSAENNNSSKTKFCFKCGASLPANANFCVGCGVKQ